MGQGSSPHHATPAHPPRHALIPQPQTPADLAALREEVEEFAKQFPTIGFERAEMRYKD